ncbi:anti-sigma-L factor RslA [Phycicoccus ginsengisoli]
MTGIDAYLDWDAAYVLGALDPAQRVEYERHLTGCARCQKAVAELAGMPGLLAQLPPGEALALGEVEDGTWPAPPPSLMPPILPDARVDASRGRAEERVVGLPVGRPAGRLVGRPVERPVRRRPRRLALALAAAVVVGALAGYAVSSATGDRAPAPAPAATAGVTGGTDRGEAPAAVRLAFSPVEPSLMTAVVDVLPVAAGTELRVECQYARAPGGYGDEGVDYAIWVVDQTGKATELHAWTAKPDVVMHPVGRTGLPVGRIDAVEIRRVTDGRTVMRARLT